MLHDPIRKKWIAATPEEIVRQKLIVYLTQDRKFPQEMITVEKELSQLPDLHGIKIPQRRLDILCFGPKLAYPLLLIECKAVPLHEKMLSQVWGYNLYVKARFVALANEKECLIGWKENGKTHYLEAIPTYSELIERC